MLAAASAAVFLLLTVARLGAQEPATWSQYQGGASHEAFVPDGPQPPFRVRWTLPAPAGDSLSAAVVVGDVAVTVGEEAVYGIDVASGDVAWQIPRAGGPLSVPAVSTDGGRGVLVYVEGPGPSATQTPSPSGPASPSSPTSASGTASPSASPSPSAADGSAVVAVALRDRSELWRTPLEGTSRSGVTIEGGTAYVGDRDGKVYALSIDDGSITWTGEVTGRADTSIAIAGGKAYVVSRDTATPQVVIAAFDAATGDRAWAPIALQASSTAGSTPTVGGGSLFVGSADRRVRALDAADGAERWNALALSIFSPATALAFDGESVFAADIAGGLYRLNAADGSRQWSFHLNEPVLRSAPAVSGSSVLLGLGNGGLVAIDVASGHLVWRSEVTAGLVGTMALAGGAVIAVKGGRNAGLIAFEHDPDGTLLDEPSPTEFDAGTTLSRWAIAAVLVFAVALVPGMLARRRFGTASEAGYADEVGGVALEEEYEDDTGEQEQHDIDVDDRDDAEDDVDPGREDR